MAREGGTAVTERRELLSCVARRSLQPSGNRNGESLLRAEVAPGIHLHRVGGHTAGLQIVSVSNKLAPVIVGLTVPYSHCWKNVSSLARADSKARSRLAT